MYASHLYNVLLQRIITAVLQLAWPAATGRRGRWPWAPLRARASRQAHAQTDIYGVEKAWRARTARANERGWGGAHANGQGHKGGNTPADGLAHH